MLEEILREHGANGTTLVVCIAAAWRFARSALRAYTERTDAIGEAIGAAHSATAAIEAAATACEKNQRQKLDRNEFRDVG